MRPKPMDMLPGKVFDTNRSGKAIITKYVSSQKIFIEFISTGTKRVVTAGDIRKGEIKDPYYPSILGIGYIGEGIYSSKNKNIYLIWYSMLHRCYCPKTQVNNPSYVGCTVCPEWHNFQNFAAWFELNYVPGLQLDKDILIDGNKQYHPNNCCIVTHQANSEKAHAKHFIVIDPQGHNHKVYNLSKFCRENQIDIHRLYLVRSGAITDTHGWKLLQHGSKISI